MLRARPGWAVLEVLVDVGNGRDGPILVEGETFVGDGQEENALRLQYAEMVGQSPDGILAMFDKVIGDDEILRGIRDCRQQLPIIDDLHVDQVERRQFWIVFAQLRSTHAIYVFDTDC